jgi:serine/threonine protein kinase/tetratricopeptide (TPR) repeat protein
VIVADRYDLLELAAAGGMGDVYRARDLDSGRLVAVKLIRARKHDSTVAARRFEREAAAVEELQDPRIVAHVANGVTPDGQAFLVTEWLSGKTVAARLQEGPICAGDALTIATQAAEAIAVVHARGMIHRDVKPSNLFLCDGRPDKVKLIDFGIVLRSDWARLTHDRTIGTPAYMPPEQVRAKTVDARADVFALGCVLYECLAGRRAFGAESVAAVLLQLILDAPPSLAEIRPDLPHSLCALVEGMLAKSPDERPRDGAAVAFALTRIDLSSDAARRAPAPSKEASLTTGERRFRCVILADPWDGDGGEAVESRRPIIAESVFLPEDRSQTLPEGDPVLAPLERVAWRSGGALDLLVDGRLLVRFEGRGTPKDVAVAAARCALALADVAPTLQMVLVAGWDIRGLPWGSASAMLQQRRRAAGPVGRAIPVDPMIVDLLVERYEVEDVGGLHVLRAEKSRIDGVRALLGQVRPLVGRSTQMATLTALLDECCDESVARAVLVTAEPGMGKSRLCHELVRHARERGRVEIWITHGDPRSEGSAFALLAQALRQASGIREGEPLDARRAKLRARLQRDLGEADRMTEALLGEIAGCPLPEDHECIPRALREDPVALGDKMRAAFCQWLAAAVAARPVLLVLEDLHWGDLPTIRVLEDALGQLSDRPLMILALARPEVHDKFPRLWERRALQEIRLPALTKKASASLAHHVLGEASTAVVDKIAERAQGNAFFLEELIRAAATASSETLPETVIAMLQRRIESQTPLARQLLRAASIFGRDFWDEGVAELVGGPSRRARVRSELALLVEGEVLARAEESRFPGAEAYRFRHGLLADAAYEMLTREDRALGHRLAAAWLSKRGEQDPLVLAGHHERGGELVEAATLYFRAAQEAHRGGDFLGALKHIDHARACGSKEELEGPLAYATALASWPIGRFADAGEGAIAAFRLLPKTAAAWHGAAMIALFVHTYTKNVAAFDETLTALGRELDGDHTGPAHLQAWCGVVHVLYRLGRVADAAVLVRRVEQRGAELRGEIPWIPFVRQLYAHYESHEPEALLLEARAAVEILVRVGDAMDRDWTRIVAALAAVAIGEPEVAERELRELDATLDGAPFLHANATMVLARAIVRQGRTEEALALARQAVELFVPMKNEQREGLARASLAEIVAAAGDLARAKEEALRAVEQLAASPPYHAGALAILSVVHRKLGEPRSALLVAREALSTLETAGGVSDTEADVRLAYAEALDASGEHDAAREAIALAKGRLLARAETILDAARRQSFLTRVPANKRTLALAQELAE